MSHTPGPWKFGVGSDNDVAFVYALNSAGTNRFFLHVQPGWDVKGTANGPDDPRTPIRELQANARLIAAAPDLLEALQTVAPYSDHLLPWIGEIVRAAIAKAEGK